MSSPRPFAASSYLLLAGWTVLVAVGGTALAGGGGRLLGWSWPAVCRGLDHVFFLGGGLLLVVATLVSKPRPPPSPEGLGPDVEVAPGRPVPPPLRSSTLTDPLQSEDLPRVQEVRLLSEQEALDRLRGRFGRLALVGTLLILWSVVLGELRGELPGIFG